MSPKTFLSLGIYFHNKERKNRSEEEEEEEEEEAPIFSST